MSSNMSKFGDKVVTPFTNLLTAKEYLETSQSDVQWQDRFWKFLDDTTKINLSCEAESTGSVFRKSENLTRFAFVLDLVSTLVFFYRSSIGSEFRT